MKWITQIHKLSRFSGNLTPGTRLKAPTPISDITDSLTNSPLNDKVNTVPQVALSHDTTEIFDDRVFRKDTDTNDKDMKTDIGELVHLFKGLST